jgi:predicted DNA-binding protein
VVIDINFTLLQPCETSRSVKGMEVNFAPDTEKKLNELAAQSGGTADGFVRDVVEGYLDESMEIQAMLDSRYDDLKSGKVQLVAGEDVESYFRGKSNAARGFQTVS